MFQRRLRPDHCREDVLSDSDGTVTFNYLQQPPPETDLPVIDVLEVIGTTDPHDIADGAFENQ